LSIVSNLADVSPLQVAIKSMKKTFDSFQSCLELREVVFLRTLPANPHLVPALDIFLDPFTKKLHIAMEYMEGNLYQLMKARDHKYLDNASVKSILFQIMQGLEHIHSHHFFHRDIKPENILVSTSAHNEPSTAFRRYSALVTPPSTPPTYTVKLADFGLARETHSKLPYTTYVSTRWYRAPEVLLRAGEYSAPVDIWAVGAMAVEVATLKPLFPGGNEVDQVWRVCEIMGSPGNWYNKSGVRVGGGDWREGTRLAGKLGFSFPKMAPHSMETILQAPQWPPALAQFVTWCLMWDPKTRPTSTQALAHEYFADAVDPLRPKSSGTSKILGRKQSDLARSSTPTPPVSSKSSWFRKSLIGRNDMTEPVTVSHGQAKDSIVPRPAPVAQIDTTTAPPRAAASKRSTWTNGASNMAPMPILPSIRPISPLSDAVHARANNRANDGTAQEKSKKIGRQLSVNSSMNHYAEMHRQQAERALNGNAGVVSPPNGQKEGFFSHLRKRARRLSGRHQTPVSPQYEDVEAAAGCAPWAGSNRSSLVVDQSGALVKADGYESLDKTLRDMPPAPPVHQAGPSNGLKRHHSLPQQHHARSVDNLIGAARNGPISSRTRRAQAAQGVQQYEAPAEEDEFLDEVLTSTHSAMRRMDNEKSLRQSASNIGLSNPYPTPSPSASGNPILFADGNEPIRPKPLDLNRKSNGHSKWPTPPYEESEWAASASASIWAAGNRI
jgi:meiosis induction protein kinase IME2/SME1